MNQNIQEQVASNQFMIYPRACCAYHPNNLVVNFCRNPNCLMPLCQDCIKPHQQEHYANGTYAEFDTIGDVQKEVTANLEQLRMKYLHHKAKQNDYLTKLQNHDVILYEQLKLARQKLNEILDKFFSALHQEIMQKHQICKEKQEIKLNEQYKIMNERQYQIENMLKTLQGENFLKSIIEFLNSTAHMDEKAFEQNLDSTLSICNMQLMDIVVNKSKLNKIHKNLSSYAIVNNSFLYEESISKQQQINFQNSQLPRQQLKMPSSILQQSSNIPQIAPQSINYSNFNFQQQTISPSIINSQYHAPSQSFAQPFYSQMISSREPEMQKPKKQKVGSGANLSKLLYPNAATMHSSLKYISKH